MSKTYTPVVISTDTFLNWLTLTNDMAGGFADVITIAANTIGDVTTGNGFVNGIFGANTLVLTNIRGGSIDTPGPMGVTSNVNFNGGQINTTSNVYSVASNTYFVSNNIVLASNSTVNVISIRANSSVTNVSIGGNLTTVTSNVTFSANATVNGLLTISNSAVVTGDLTVATQSVMSSNAASLSGTSDQLIDSFNGSTYRGGKYVISMKDDANSTYQMTEVLVMHDGTTAYTTEYATLKSVANSLATAVSNVSGSTVRLYLTPTVASLSVKLSKTLTTV